ncbi:MAG TPA: ATP-binding protein [Candidatus Angelobacter sp.]|jgi:signal transduction histidine kinase|nr:ATP-binding protein [Candidatus Angelobacter sp.]
MSSISSGALADFSHPIATLKTGAFRFSRQMQRFASPEWRFRINPYWLAVLSPLFGFALRLAIDPWLGDQMPYITFLVAVALVGLFAGVGPSLLATGLGAVIAYWCFVSPRHHWGFQGVSDAAGFFSYLAAALGIVLLTGARKKAYAQAERRLHEQLAAEGKLRDAQKVFQLFMDNRPGFSYLRERNGRYVYFNNAACSLLRLEGGQTELPQVLSELQQQDEEVFKSEPPHQFINKIALPDGERYWLTTKFSLVNEEKQKFVGSVSTDITDQIRAEEIAVEKERLIAATEMLATVAHEVNNPLAALTSSVYLLANETLPPRAKELADITQRELSRLAHITRLVLGFYQEAEHPIAVDPSDLIKDVIETLSNRFAVAKPHIVCDFAWRGTLSLPGRQAREVLENILANAFESGATQIRVRVRPSNDWRNFARQGCRISILDDGHGMNHGNQKRAFEPFFSTKTQRGNGLGLWLSKAIVLKNGGLISLHSTDHVVRHCTCISIFLPSRVAPRTAPGIGRRKDVQRASKTGLPRAAC